jgi:glutamate 5-kinase
VKPRNGDKTTHDRQSLKDCRRIVVKVGSSVLAGPTGAGLHEDSIRSLANQISALRREGRQIILVSSGAVSAGLQALGLKRSPKSMPHKQAAAAVGQTRLIQAYQGWFQEEGITVGQILLTHDDVHHRTRFLNARNTIFALLDRGVLPIVNENDTVSVEEIRFGDNDTLSSLIATMVEADLLIILTDVDGLYSSNPRKDSEARLIDEVGRVNREIESMAQEGKSEFGAGGMVTKVRAVKAVSEAGIPAVVTKGRGNDVLVSVVRGEPAGTFFRPEKAPLSGRKSWIAFARRPQGKIIVDEGAQTALAEKGKSLLPSGVVSVEGKFAFGDSTACCAPGGQEFARGLVNYGSADLERIKGRKTADIRSILGFKEYDEVIHRDNLVLLP